MDFEKSLKKKQDRAGRSSLGREILQMVYDGVTTQNLVFSTPTHRSTFGRWLNSLTNHQVKQLLEDPIHFAVMSAFVAPYNESSVEDPEPLMTKDKISRATSKVLFDAGWIKTKEDREKKKQ